jgi:hypothetical protein
MSFSKVWRHNCKTSDNLVGSSICSLSFLFFIYFYFKKKNGLKDAVY